ncbi:fatty acid cis/trans isomerase, partial [Pseudomonas aeruginosa]
GVQGRAHPFAISAGIPPRARYQFMLDNAESFTRTFIRGPVCRGQIATDVIRDNFWVVFQDPEQDLFVTDATFRAQSAPLLALPGQFDALKSLLGRWSADRAKRNEYEDLGEDVYAGAPPPTWTPLWHGNAISLPSNSRQFDSSSVRRGLLG